MYFPIEVQEIRRPNRVYKLSVKCFTKISEIKDMLQKIIQFPPNRMQIFHSSRTVALGNQTTLHEIGIDHEGFLLMLSLQLACNCPHLIETLKGFAIDTACKEIIQDVKQGLVSGNGPSKTDLLDCTGGVYFMKGTNGNNVAVFKPHDEEQGMPNNPKGYAGNGKNGLRQHFLPGEGYLREVAAYLLDYKNFCKVPATCVVHCEHPIFHYPNSTKSLFPKLGSLQLFVKASDTFEDISPSLIGTLELQKIALFDMRTLNCDRNSANILAIRKSVQIANRSNRRNSRSDSMTSNGEDYDGEEMDLDDFMDRPYRRNPNRNDDCYELIPIDHGYCLPSKLLIDEYDWAWFYCSQISQEVDPEIKKYMNEIDIEAQIDMLRSQVALPEDCFFLLKVTHNLILDGINNGLTLRDIAALIARTEDGVPSPLEKAIQAAEENAYRAVEAHGGFPTNILNSPPRGRGKSPNTVNSIVNSVLSLPIAANSDSRYNNSPHLLSSYASSNSLSTFEANTFQSLNFHSSAPANFSFPTMSNAPKTNPKKKEDRLEHIVQSTFPPKSISSTPTISYSDLNSSTQSSGEQQDSDINPLVGFQPNPIPFQTKAATSQSNNGTNQPQHINYNNLALVSSYLRHGGAALTTMQSLDSSRRPARLGTFSSDSNFSRNTSATLLAETSAEPSPHSLYDDFIIRSGVNQPICGAGVSELGEMDYCNETFQPLDSPDNDESSQSATFMEVPIVQEVEFDKSSAHKTCKERHSSGCTSEEETEESHTDTMNTPLSPGSDLLSDLPKLSITAGMARVVSFGAFESPALYEVDRNDRHFNKLKREKRKLSAKSPEFKELRMHFVRDAVTKTIHQYLRAK